VRCSRVMNLTDVDALATFDFAAFFTAVDDARRDRDMGWYEVADELWNQSAELNAERGDHPVAAAPGSGHQLRRVAASYGA
jgi:hypothetical protein